MRIIRTAHSIFLLSMIIAAVADGKSIKRLLNLNYTQRRIIGYDIDYKARCVIQDKDSVNHEDMHINCKIGCRASKNGQRLDFILRNVAIETSLYDTQTVAGIKDELLKAQYSFALINGCPVVDTMTGFTKRGLKEWDLLLQFARLLPDIPNQPVKKGYSWERSAVYMVPTAHEKTLPCNVYQLYEVKEFSKTGDSVTIHWDFRYAAEHSAIERGEILKRVPISGRGKGITVIDLKQGVILSTEIHFKTPIAEYMGTTVFWTEDTSMKLRPRKDTPESEE